MLLFGDLNFDMLNSDKSATLNDFCDIFNLSQLVNGPTCFKKGCIPSLVDVIMTTRNHYVLSHKMFQQVSVTAITL